MRLRNHFKATEIEGIRVSEIELGKAPPGRVLKTRTGGGLAIQLRVNPEGHFIANWVHSPERTRYVGDATIVGAYQKALKVIEFIDRRPWKLMMQIDPERPPTSPYGEVNVFWCLGALRGKKTIFADARWDDTKKVWTRGDDTSVPVPNIWRKHERVEHWRGVIPFDRELFDKVLKFQEEWTLIEKSLTTAWHKDPINFTKDTRTLLGRIHCKPAPKKTTAKKKKKVTTKREAASKGVAKRTPKRKRRRASL